MSAGDPAVPPLPVLQPEWSTGLEAPIAACAFTGQDADLAVLPGEGGLRIIDGVTGVERRVLPGHACGNLALAISPLGLVATGGWDGVARVTSLVEDRLASYQVGPHWVEHLAWHPNDGRLAASCGRQVVVFNTSTQKRCTSPDLPATVAGLAWHRQGHLLAVAAYGGVWLLNALTLAIELHLTVRGSPVSLAWSSDGHRLAAGLQDGGLQTWDFRRMIDDPDGWVLGGFERAVRLLAWHGDTVAASGGLATVLYRFDRYGPEGLTCPALHGHPDPVTALILRPDGGWITGDATGGVLLWDGLLPEAAVVHDQAITALAWQAPGLLAIGAADGTLLGVETPP
jgi:WD40 repeat protein